MINGKDKHGAALIHYVAALNLYEIIDCLVLRTKVDLRQTVGSSTRLTPIAIAGVLGNQDTYKAFKKYGYSLFVESAGLSSSSQGDIDFGQML